MDEFNRHSAENGTLQIDRYRPYAYGFCFVLYNVEFIEFLEICGITFDVKLDNLLDAKIPGHELNSFQ